MDPSLVPSGRGAHGDPAGVAERNTRLLTTRCSRDVHAPVSFLLSPFLPVSPGAFTPGLLGASRMALRKRTFPPDTGRPLSAEVSFLPETALGSGATLSVCF